MKVSFHVGKAGKQMNRTHNTRGDEQKGWNKDGHIDRSKSHLNSVLVYRDLDKLLRDELRQAVEDYNEKNRVKHPERVKSLDEVVKDGKAKARELIVQIGNKDEQLSNQDYADFYTQYVEEFQKANPSFKVFGAYIHMDETTPHLHLDFVPICDSLRGICRKVSLDGALKEIGFKDTGKYAETAFKQWMIDERTFIEDAARPFMEDAGFTFEANEASSKEHCTQHKERWQWQAEQAQKQLAESRQKAAESRLEVEKAKEALNNLESDLDAGTWEKEALDMELKAKQAEIDKLTKELGELKAKKPINEKYVELAEYDREYQERQKQNAQTFIQRQQTAIKEMEEKLCTWDTMERE